jgi:hypothetical protein
MDVSSLLVELLIMYLYVQALQIKPAEDFPTSEPTSIKGLTTKLHHAELINYINCTWKRK